MTFLNVSAFCFVSSFHDSQDFVAVHVVRVTGGHVVDPRFLPNGSLNVRIPVRIGAPECCSSARECQRRLFAPSQSPACVVLASGLRRHVQSDISIRILCCPGPWRVSEENRAPKPAAPASRVRHIPKADDRFRQEALCEHGLAPGPLAAIGLAWSCPASEWRPVTAQQPARACQPAIRSFFASPRCRRPQW